jgi:hypothetical protein
MHVATTLSPRHRSAPARLSTAAPARIEPLEGRVLMSAWTTSDTNGDNTLGEAWQVACDPAGNIYVAGAEADKDNAANPRDVIRMKPSGGEWATIYNQAHRDGWSGNQRMAVNADGDIYVTSFYGIVLKWNRSQGATMFTPVDQPAPLVTNKSTSYPQATALTIDAAGNVYVAGNTPVIGAQNTIRPQWTVRKQTGGQGPFVTVDLYAYPATPARGYADAITAIPAGPAAGLYATGHCNAPDGTMHWIVRRSTDAGKTWSLADDFPGGAMGAGPYGVAGDVAGNVYVTGTAFTVVQGGTKRNPTTTYTRYWMTRKGVANAAGSLSWGVSDAFTTPATGGNFLPQDVAVDTAGKVFVAGISTMTDSSGVASDHGIVRSNESGVWQTVDDIQGSWPSGARFLDIAADNGGSVFAAGYTTIGVSGDQYWTVRTNSAATASAAPAPDPVIAVPASTFSTAPISADTPERDPALDLTGTATGLLA